MVARPLVCGVVAYHRSRAEHKQHLVPAHKSFFCTVASIDKHKARASIGAHTQPYVAAHHSGAETHLDADLPELSALTQQFAVIVCSPTTRLLLFA